MKNLAEYLVKGIVAEPKKVTVIQEEKEGLVKFTLKVADDDLKFVIGKGGRTIRALRQLLRVRALKEKKAVNLELAS